MTNPVVGSARIEFTGDLNAFAARSEADIKRLFAEMQRTVTTQLNRVEEQFGKGGTQSGQAFSRGATTTMRTGATAAVNQSTREVRAKASAGYAAAGKESGGKFAGGVKSGLLTAKGLLLGGAALAGADFVRGAFAEAVQAEKAGVKIGNVFGDNADAVKKWSTSVMTSLRQDDDEIGSLAATYGQYLKGFGAPPDAIAQLSEKLTEATYNIAEFKQVDKDAVSQAFGAALRGRTAALKQYGIVVDSNLQIEEAYRHGIIKTKSVISQADIADARQKLAESEQKLTAVLKDQNATQTDRAGAQRAVTDAQTALTAAQKGSAPVLTAQQKAYATYYAILDKTTDAQGAVSKSADTARGRQQLLSVQFQQVQEQVGGLLLPALASLSGFVLHDVIPVIQDFTHWVQENKSWIEPLAKVLGGLAVAYLGVKVAIGAVNKVQSIGRDIAQGYRKTVETATKVIDTVTGRSRAAQATAEDRLTVATKGGTTAIGTQAEVASAGAAEMLGYAEATNAAAAAQERLALAGGGKAGVVRKGAGAAESVGAAAVGGGGKVAGGAATQAGERAGLMTAAETAAKGAAGGIAAAEGAATLSMGAFAASIAVGGLAVIGLAKGINTLTGEDASWKKFGNLMKTIDGIGKATDKLTDAMRDDNNQIGKNTVSFVGAELQALKLDTALAGVGSNLLDATSALTGTDAQFQNFADRLKDSGRLTQEQEGKLAALRGQFVKARGDAGKMATQQKALNDLVAGFGVPPPKPVVLTAKDTASKVIAQAKHDLELLNGRRANVYIGAIIEQQGGRIKSKGSGGGFVEFYAGGGDVRDGWFVAGEDGPEIGKKDGSRVTFMSNADSMRSMAETHSTRMSAASSSGLSDSDLAALLAAGDRPVNIIVDGRVLARTVKTNNERLARIS